MGFHPEKTENYFYVGKSALCQLFDHYSNQALPIPHSFDIISNIVSLLLIEA